MKKSSSKKILSAISILLLTLLIFVSTFSQVSNNPGINQVEKIYPLNNLISEQSSYLRLRFSATSLICAVNGEVGSCGTGGGSGGSGGLVDDTNWQTNFTAFDNNLKGQYRKFTKDINTTENVNADKNMNAAYLNVETLNISDVNYSAQPAPAPVYKSSFLVPPTAGARTDTFSLGFRFQVQRTIVVTKLGRMHTPGNTKNHNILLWNAANQSTPIISANILNATTPDANGIKWVDISPVTLSPGVNYAISIDENGGDAWKDVWNPTLQSVFNVQGDAFTSTMSAYPSVVSGNGNRMYTTPTMYYYEFVPAQSQIIANVAVDGNGYFSDTLTATSFKVGEDKGITNNTGFWLCKDSSCNVRCQVTLKGGIIIDCI
jgi:hypothetical protein